MDRARFLRETVELTSALIRCRSLSGQEELAARTLEAAMSRLGFDAVRIDRLGNVVGVIRGSRPGPRLLFDGHMDVVPVADSSRWTREPFGGDVAEGRVWGRGASDMKGALAAMTVAAALFAEQTGGDFAGELHVAGTVHEELFEGVAAREVSANVAPDFVVIGEASELDLKIGQRGRAEVVVETIGRPAHSASPEKGVNAVLSMCALLPALSVARPPEHPILGKGVAVVTDVMSSPYPGSSVVPARCRATFDRRVLVGETRESVLAGFQAVIDGQALTTADFKAEVRLAEGRELCWTGAGIEGERFFPAWLFSPEDDFVSAALAGLRAAGLDSALSHYSFCTNGSHYAGEAGIRTLGFGPSLETLAHVDDEFISVEQLDKALTGYAAISAALLA